jgi:hypothetical protein
MKHAPKYPAATITSAQIGRWGASNQAEKRIVIAAPPKMTLVNGAPGENAGTATVKDQA